MNVYEHHPVWLIEERCFGEIVQWGAYASIIKYDWNGYVFEELLENDEFVFIDELGIQYEYDG